MLAVAFVAVEPTNYTSDFISVDTMVSYTFVTENSGRHCWERPAGEVDSEITLLIQENSKPQDRIS